MIAVTVSPAQVIAGQDTTLTFTARSEGNTSDIGTLTIGVDDANGDEVVASGTAVTDNSDGTYEYALSAQSDPALLVVTLTEAGGDTFTLHIEVVGNVLFTEAALRTFDDDQLNYDALNPTDDEIGEVRRRVTEFLEQQTGRSWIPRYNRTVLAGNGNTAVDLRMGYHRTSTGQYLHRPGARRDIQRILSANDGAAVSAGVLDVFPDGTLVRTSGYWTQPTITNPFNVTVEYVYGLPYPVDGVDRVAMMIAAHQLKSSRITENVTSFSDSLGTYQFDTTRLPFEAYQWIKSHREHAPFA